MNGGLFALNTPQTTPSVMVDIEMSYWFEEAVWTRKCSGCGKKGTQKVLRIIGDNADQTHALVRCHNARCSWNDCTLHLVFNRPEYVATLTRQRGGEIDVPAEMVKPTAKKPTTDLFSIDEPAPAPKVQSLFDI
jgi:hypothetical protein